MDLESFGQKAQEKHSEQLSILKQLRKKPPKNLDYLMQDIHDEVFDKIDCLTCANCCKTTGPLFRSKDIERISKSLRIKPSDFVANHLKLDEDQDYVLQSLPCPFLDADNYCLIYDNRPKACREFPHIDRKKFHQINSLTIKNCKICPAAFQAVERLGEILKT